MRLIADATSGKRDDDPKLLLRLTASHERVPVLVRWQGSRESWCRLESVCVGIANEQKKPGSA
jgi:hypothetical protein